MFSFEYIYVYIKAKTHKRIIATDRLATQLLQLQLRWPVLMQYPEHHMTDVIAEFCETSTFEDELKVCDTIEKREEMIKGDECVWRGGKKWVDGCMYGCMYVSKYAIN